MKYCILVLAAVLAGGLAAAQSATNTYIPSLNGGTEQASSVVSTDGTHTQIAQSINGVEVPLQQTDQKVLHEDANSKVTETIVRKYSPNGELASTERIVTEEQKRPNGSLTHSTTYRSDVNGQMKEAERQTIDAETSGATTHTNTTVERPGLDDSFQTVEKREAVAEKTDNTVHEDETIYRPSGNGGFSAAFRQVTDTSHSGDQTIDKTAQYQPVAGEQMQLIKQSVTTTTTAPDGSELSEVNLYGPSVPGNVQGPDAPQKLFEQDIVERQKGPGGSVTETTSVRRPTGSDPNQLGPASQISKTVCTGNCDSDKK